MSLPGALSVGQRALWYLYQLAPGSAAYNVVTAVRILSPVDTGRLAAATDAVLARHETLRTVFDEVQGEPYRVAGDASAAALEVHDAKGCSDEQLAGLLRDFAAQPFSLRHQVCRFGLFQRAEDDSALVIVAHHIATDAASCVLLLRDLFEAYRAAGAGEDPQWPPLPGSFDDYVEQERQLLDSPQGEELAAHWRSVCADAVAAELPVDRPRPARRRFRGATHKVAMPPVVAANLRSVASDARVTAFAYLLGVFQVLLHHYTRQREFLLGCTTTVRRGLAMRDVVGYLVNPIVLKATLDPRMTFVDAARAAHEQLLRGMNHGRYPFPLVAGGRRDSLLRITFTLVGPNPLVPLSRMLPVGDEEGEDLQYDGLLLRQVDVPQMEGQFDLSVEVRQSPAALVALLRYDTDLFNAGTIERFGAHWAALAETAVEYPGRTVFATSLASGAETAAVLGFGAGDDLDIADI